MHLGFLTSEYPHQRTNRAGGIGTSIKNMATALAAKGIKVSVFIYGQKEEDIFKEEGITFHLIKNKAYKFFGWYFHRKSIEQYLNHFIALHDIAAMEAPDWTGITAFMKLRCPLVIRMNGSDAYFCKLDGRPQKKKNFWFEKMAFQGADHILSVSQFTAEETKKIFHLKKEILVIPNAVDVQKFVPQEKKFTSNKLLYFGTLIRKKGLLELASIFNEVVQQKPEAALYLAGKDVVDVFTKRSTKQLMLEIFTPEAAKQVHWLGMLPYEEVLQQIAAAHVVVLPSFAEALPMTWLEAMAMEKALVTSNIGWAKEVMVNGKTGFTEDPKDHTAYAGKILKLLNDPAMAAEMGKAARVQVVTHFSTDVVTQKNINFYKSLLSC